MSLLLRILSGLFKIAGGGWALYGVIEIGRGFVESRSLEHATLFDPFDIALIVGGLVFIVPGLAMAGIGILLGRLKVVRARRAQRGRFH